MKTTLDRIKEEKVIAIIRRIPRKFMLPTAHALISGGIHMMEITFDHSDERGIEETADSIRVLAKELPEEILLGAGTVLSPKEVFLAHSCGARYILSPNMDPAVIRTTKELGMVSIPGAYTPSEIVSAHDAGADIVKLFPAAMLGTEYVKSILAPLPHIPVSAVGGIDEKNIAAFFQAGVCGVGIGGNLVSRTRVLNGDFQSITATAKKLTAAIR